MDEVRREVLVRGIAPMLAGIVLALVGLYTLGGRDTPLWELARGSLVVGGLVLLVVPLFMVVIPRLLPPEDGPGA